MCIDLKRFCRLLPAIFLVALPTGALAEGSLDSTTVLRIEQENHSGLPTRTMAPLTEFFGLDLDQLGDGNLSAHLYGWGRLDLADRAATVDNSETSLGGALNYGYLQYRFDHANAKARLGRFSVMEGVSNEQVDGASFRTDLPYGLGISAFGGANVHTVDIPGTNTDGKGDGIFGGRASYRKGGILEVGLSGVYESAAPVVNTNSYTNLFLPGAFGNHRLIGGDIWLRPFNMVQLSGHSSYNTETGKVAEHSYLLQLTPYKELLLSATFDEHHDRDFFYSSLLFASMLRDLSQESRVIGGSASYPITGAIDASADYKHYSRDLGKADRFGGELRGNFLQNTLRTGVGYHYLRASSDFAIVPTTGASGSFHEAHVYALHDTKSYFSSLDVIGYFFKEPVENRDAAWETTGSVGYHLTPDLALSGDLSYGKNPQYDDELKGLLRLTYNVKFGTKGDK